MRERSIDQAKPDKTAFKTQMEKAETDASVQLRIDSFIFAAYSVPAFAKNESRDLHTEKNRPQSATLYSGFFVPTKNTGGIMPFVICYGGMY